MALTSGTKLGPYEIQSSLGAGGMGEVYRARDTRLERDVAVKVLPANLSSDSSLRQRLDHEAKAVSKLSHPHICTLHDVGHQNGVDFLVMELIEGETLEDRLTKGPLSTELTIRIGPTRSGRTVFGTPLSVLLFVTMLTGFPLCAWTIVATCQPRVSACPVKGSW